MLKIKIFTLLLAILFLSTACNPTRNNIFAPNKKIFKMLPKDAPADYAEGWNDGCETGLSTGFANDYYKTFYGFKKNRDQVKRNNKMYLRPWSSAMIFCRHYALGTLKEGNMTSSLPGQDGFVAIGNHSILGNSMAIENWGSIGLSNW
jgi:hypothetical protein